MHITKLIQHQIITSRQMLRLEGMGDELMFTSKEDKQRIISLDYKDLWYEYYYVPLYSWRTGEKTSLKARIETAEFYRKHYLPNATVGFCYRYDFIQSADGEDWDKGKWKVIIKEFDDTLGWNKYNKHKIYDKL